MTLQKLIDRTTIRFKAILNEEEVESLFKYLSLKLNCEINYRIEHRGRFTHFSRNFLLELPSELSEEKYPSKIWGSITRTDDGLTTATFECVKGLSDVSYDKFSGIRFFTTQLELFDTIKENTAKFFSQ